MHRTRRLLVVVVVAGAATSAWPASGAAGPCRSSEVKRTVAYDQGGKVRKVTACVPRSWSKAPTLRQGRTIVKKLAPEPIAALLRGRAARRVSGADPVLDRAITGAQLPPAKAAIVSHGGDTQSLRGGPAGTKTVQTRSSTEWGPTEPNPGSDLDVGVDTKGQGSSKRATYKLRRTMSRCPDAGGIGRGVIKFSMRETQVVASAGGGHGVTETLTTYEAKVLVHFNDSAAVQSVEVLGDWSYSNETRMAASGGGKEKRLTRHTVGGGVSGGTAPDGSKSTVGTTVTKASNSSMAIYGLLAGAIANTILDTVPGELVRESASRARSGACAKIVPDPVTVHVRPGQTVALTATLNDGAGARLPGTVRAAAAQALVSPGTAQADPTARFTYHSLPQAPPGLTDTVALDHVSKRGLANTKTVTVIYDPPPPLPARFDGTWTRVVTQGALIQTFHGTAAFVKHPLFGPDHPGTEETSVPYVPESARVDWSVSGSESSGNCTVTYSGSGTEVYSPETWKGAAAGSTALALQDIRRGAGAPQSEPNPWNYAIQATGDPENGPKYTITRAGPTPECGFTTQEYVGYHYLDVGTPSYDESDPPDQVQRSNSATLLEGHHFEPAGAGPATDDTWKFTGSG